MSDANFRASPYCSVYAALRASLDAGGNVVVGTEAAISRGRHWLLARGERDRAEALEQLSIEVTRLQLALRARDEAAAQRARARLENQTTEWLLAAPMLATAADPALAA